MPFTAQLLCVLPACICNRSIDLPLLTMNAVLIVELVQMEVRTVEHFWRIIEIRALTSLKMILGSYNNGTDNHDIDGVILEPID